MRRVEVRFGREAQRVSVDSVGRFTVQLGATTSGISPDLFPSDQPRWLGVQMQGQPEQPRALLVSVPYAMKAGEADKLAGHAAGDFVTADVLQAAVQQQVQQQLSVPSVVRSAARNRTLAGTTPLTSTVDLATNFIDNTLDQVVSVQQNGTGVALIASAPSNSAVVATSNARPEPGVLAAVEGISSLDSSFGIFGAATSRSSSHPGIGVH